VDWIQDVLDVVVHLLLKLNEDFVSKSATKCPSMEINIRPLFVIVWWCDLQLPVQSVPMTTNVVSSNPFQAIQHHVIKFVSAVMEAINKFPFKKLNKPSFWLTPTKYKSYWRFNQSVHSEYKERETIAVQNHI
jgi:hypothetical protein